MRAATRLSILALGLALALGLTKSMTRADDAPATAKATGTVSGKVVDSTGKAVSGATVNALPPAAAPAGGAAGGGRGQRPTPLATATTGDDGTFKLDKVPVGKVRITANLRGTGRGTVPSVEVTDGKDTKVDDIKLAPAAPRGGGAGGGAGNAAGAGN